MIKQSITLFLSLISSSSAVLAHPYHYGHGAQRMALINDLNGVDLNKSGMGVYQRPTELWPLTGNGYRPSRGRWIRRPAPVAMADNNNCIEGTVIGGLLGAGLGAALSRGNGRWIGVPVGTAAGALVGCQVDGG